jgi:hypothetical protein
MEKPTARQLVEAAGISRTYAHDIVADNQQPSRPLAIHLYRKTGWRFAPIQALTDEQIDVLETVEPWVKAA